MHPAGADTQIAEWWNSTCEIHALLARTHPDTHPDTHTHCPCFWKLPWKVGEQSHCCTCFKGILLFSQGGGHKQILKGVKEKRPPFPPPQAMFVTLKANFYATPEQSFRQEKCLKLARQINHSKLAGGVIHFGKF